MPLAGAVLVLFALIGAGGCSKPDVPADAPQHTTPYPGTEVAPDELEAIIEEQEQGQDGGERQ